MRGMFSGSKFNGDISNWNTSKVQNMGCMFENSPLENNPPF
jgi:surface protein